LFDEFRKEEQVSRGYRLVFQAMDKTLTNEEVQAELDAVYAALTAAGATIR